MVEVIQTKLFTGWFENLRDTRARSIIRVRIDRLLIGNPGVVKPVGHGVSELKIDHGPGYRVYFTRRGEQVIVLLAGGDKSSQDRDIAKALELAKEL